MACNTCKRFIGPEYRYCIPCSDKLKGSGLCLECGVEQSYKDGSAYSLVHVCGDSCLRNLLLRQSRNHKKKLKDLNILDVQLRESDRIIRDLKEDFRDLKEEYERLRGDNKRIKEENERLRGDNRRIVEEYESQGNALKRQRNEDRVDYVPQYYPVAYPHVQLSDAAISELLYILKKQASGGQ